MASAASHLPSDPQAMLAVPAVSCAEGAERDAGAGAAPRWCTPRRRRVCDEAQSEVRGEHPDGPRGLVAQIKFQGVKRTGRMAYVPSKV